MTQKEILDAQAKDLAELRSKLMGILPKLTPGALVEVSKAVIDVCEQERKVQEALKR